MRKVIIAANWKENKSNEEVAEFINSLRQRLSESGSEILIFPSYVSIITASDCSQDSDILIGAQNISQYEKGAYTGEVSVEMIKDFCDYVLLGHSESRKHFGEDNELINAKLRLVLENKLKVILCIGETMEHRKNNQTENVLKEQLEVCLAGVSQEDLLNVAIAYEPIWAISGGDANHEPATPDDAQASHSFIRNWLNERFGEVSKEIRIIYGGSVKPGNAKSFLEKQDIDGALVGNASLDVDSFLEIIG